MSLLLGKLTSSLVKTVANTMAATYITDAVFSTKITLRGLRTNTIGSISERISDAIGATASCKVAEMLAPLNVLKDGTVAKYALEGAINGVSSFATEKLVAACGNNVLLSDSSANKYIKKFGIFAPKSAKEEPALARSNNKSRDVDNENKSKNLKDNILSIAGKTAAEMFLASLTDMLDNVFYNVFTNNRHKRNSYNGAIDFNSSCIGGANEFAEALGIINNKTTISSAYNNTSLGTQNTFAETVVIETISSYLAQMATLGVKTVAIAFVKNVVNKEIPKKQKILVRNEKSSENSCLREQKEVAKKALYNGVLKGICDFFDSINN